MLASRPVPRSHAGTSGRGGHSHRAEPAPTGWRRLLLAYLVSALAVVVGLPGLAAGLITANTCTLRSMDCAGASFYGIVGGGGLAVIIQLVLAVQFRIGWPFWLVSLFGVVAAGCGVGSPWLLIPAVAVVPAIAGWVTDPSRWPRAGWRRRIPRLAALVLLPVVMFGAGFLTGGIGLPFS